MFVITCDETGLEYRLDILIELGEEGIAGNLNH